jgi:predicted Zn-dependent protease
MPVDDDYFGIRRALWASTDAVYRAAARNFKDNVTFLKEQKKELKDLPHRSFAKVPVTKVRVTGPENPMDRQKLEELARTLSLVFKDYEAIGSSSVVIRCHRTRYYFLNSEGTETITTDNGATISVNAQTRADDGETIFDQRIYTALTTDGLPAVETLTREIRDMAQRLVSLRTTPVFKDSYTGPVLFMGPAAVDVFSNNFGETLVASKSIARNYSYFDARMGRRLLDERFTIKSTPKLKTFNNTALLGAYEVDDEGVVPADELVLIENGILRNLLNDRTLVKEDQVANGHGSGAGVLNISSAQGMPEDKLKALLIEEARKEGLDYALIVRHFSTGSIRTLDTYKVSLTDGKEELVRSANVSSASARSLKRILGVSNEQIALNISNRNTTLSIIAPSALLLEEIEVDGSRNNPYPDREVYVENPVKLNP